MGGSTVGSPVHAPSRRISAGRDMKSSWRRRKKSERGRVKKQNQVACRIILDRSQTLACQRPDNPPYHHRSDYRCQPFTKRRQFRKSITTSHDDARQCPHVRQPVPVRFSRILHRDVRSKTRHSIGTRNGATRIAETIRMCWSMSVTQTLCNRVQSGRSSEENW